VPRHCFSRVVRCHPRRAYACTDVHFSWVFLILLERPTGQEERRRRFTPCAWSGYIAVAIAAFRAMHDRSKASLTFLAHLVVDALGPSRLFLAFGCFIFSTSLANCHASAAFVFIDRSFLRRSTKLRHLSSPSQHVYVCFRVMKERSS
jgi:hypothetical protein